MTHLVFEKDFSHHPLHYFTLLCILLVGLWGILWFDYHPVTQLIIVVCLAVSYIIWGIVHHHVHRSLHPKIILEYVLVAALAVLAFASLTLRP